jgi:hypothetical protein
VEGDVVELRLGVAARADVLHLQDQARRGGVGFIEKAAVERHPQLRALLVSAAHLDRKRFDAAIANGVERIVELRPVLWHHEICELVVDDRRAVGAPEQRQQGLVGLQDAALK